MALENCSQILEVCEGKNCSQILENCSIRKICNLTGDFFGGSPDQSVTRIVLLGSAIVLFIFLILKDGLKSLKIRAQWIPAYLMPAMANPGAEDFWGKIMALVIVVFLHVLSELYILNPSFAGLYLKTIWPKQRGTSINLYYIFAALMFFSFILLLLLLGCANIAGRGIERILAEKIPVILKGQVKEHYQHQHHHSDERVGRTVDDHPYHFRCQGCWQRVEDEVLRAWIVARAYSLEHIIARSALAASAATVVTIQIIITIIAGVWNSPKLVLCGAEDRLMLAITILQCVFILIGWSMIGWRWATAVAYYGSCRSRLWIEDFWTRHLKELQQVNKTRLPQAELLHAKIENLVANESTKITLPGILLYAVIALQWYTVSFSKACWFVSRKLFCNKLTRKLLSSIYFKNYSKYEAVLKGVQILGETPESLWLSNRKSILIAEGLVSRGKQDCERECQNLVDFVSTNRTGLGLGLNCLEPNKPQSGLNYLCKGTQQPREEQFTDMSRKSWKMTAVSLLNIIIQLSPICVETEKEHPSTSQLFPPKVVKDCLDAYSQAWEIIDFVDNADAEADEITSQAADQYFFTLKAKVDAASNSRDTWTGSDSTDIKEAERVTAALAELKNQCKSRTKTSGSVNAHALKSKEEKDGKSKAQTAGSVNALRLKSKENIQGPRTNGWNGNDSTDWSAAAWASAVYKLSNSIQFNEESHVSELLKELESSLADIINECLERIQDLLFLNSRKWVVNSDKRKNAKALYTGGKARMIMEMLREKIDNIE
ncbi:uncharacterized protein LOC131064666 [Cryptomeria japonica]|uniref:uncharacterized protein LOC131064666 n=1 Tax=Cryptomeria japonica TaxID=3369 RepID=UPI0027DA72E1|nr:uncharacterized protein LOC131064666 [Cryptomeria japonica]